MSTRITCVVDIDEYLNGRALTQGDLRHLARAATEAAAGSIRGHGELWDITMSVVPVRYEIDGVASSLCW